MFRSPGGSSASLVRLRWLTSSAEDPQMEHMQAVAEHWPGLPRREQKVLLMRF